jgi:hypothetical protein
LLREEDADAANLNETLGSAVAADFDAVEQVAGSEDRKKPPPSPGVTGRGGAGVLFSDKGGER